MTSTNSKTPAKVAEVCLDTYCIGPQQNTAIYCKAQAPRMGTALAAFLRRYRDDLLPYVETTGSCVALAMVECCDFLLIEADRLERGQS